MRAFLFGAVAACAAAFSGEATAAPPSQNTCFRSEDYQSFKAVNDHSFYIRVGLHDIWRIDLSGSCPVLTAPDARLLVVEHGFTQICGPLDWQLRVASPSDPPIGCVVANQTHLTPQQAAAVPPSQQP